MVKQTKGQIDKWTNGQNGHLDKMDNQTKWTTRQNEQIDKLTSGQIDKWTN